MKRENFTFWREINKLFKLGKFGASSSSKNEGNSSLHTKKTKQSCIGQSMFTWINIKFSSNLKLQACNLKKMTLHIPNHTILTVHKTVNQNQQQSHY